MIALFEFKMQKLRSFWKTTRDPNEQQSSTILEKTHNFFTTSFRRPINPQVETTIQFDEYLISLPVLPRIKKRKGSKAFSYNLKPELLQKCLQTLDPRYLDIQYQVNEDFFQKNKIISYERQTSMHQQLDEVQICLFNQITSRFDEIMSVLLTIRSLECLVIENQHKLGVIRQTFLFTMRNITEKQIRGSKLSKKKQNIQKLHEKLMHLKKYKKFVQLSTISHYSDRKQISSSTTSQTHSDKQQAGQTFTREELAIHFQQNLNLYKSLQCTKNIQNLLEVYEEDIRQNFSHQLNKRIFQYSCHFTQLLTEKQQKLQANTHSSKFWNKLKHSKNIWQQNQYSNNNSLNNSMAVLDESVIEDSDDNIKFTIKVIIDQQIEDTIIIYYQNCWNQGEFQATELKKMYSNYLKNIHQQFFADFRDFCDQLCKDNQKIIDNPSLQNLLNNFSIQFCVKAYNYFIEIHKNILLRTFSLVSKFLKFGIKIGITGQDLTIEQRYKISILIQGIIDLCKYVVSLIIEKLCDVIQLKTIHVGIDIMEFKNVIAVMQTFEQFAKNKLFTFLQISQQCKQESFLYELVHNINEKLSLNALYLEKLSKLQKYLGKMHKNSIQQQLKQSLQEQTWVTKDIPTFYYDSLHFLMTGQSLNLRKNRNHFKHGPSINLGYETSVLADGNGDSFMFTGNQSKLGTNAIADFRIIRNQIVIKNKMYKVTQTILLLVQLIEDYVLLAKTFPQIKKEVGFKLCELIRSYNTSSCQLIVYAGAMSLGKINSKNITSRHLSLSALCVSFLLVLIECTPIRQLIMQSAQLKKQKQTNSNEVTQFKKLEKALTEHKQTIINKLYQILIHKVNSLQPTISFVADRQIPTKGTQGIIYNIKIMHEIMLQYFDEATLRKIFTEELLGLYLQAIRGNSNKKIRTRVEAEGLKDDIGYFFTEIQATGVHKLIGVDNVSKYRISAEEVLRTVFEGISQFA